MSFQFIKSQKGNDQLVINGFRFNRNGAVNTTRYWKCVEFTSQGCQGRAITEHGQIKKHLVSLHNHVSNPAAVECKKYVNLVKEKAKISAEEPSKVLAEFDGKVHVAAQGVVPNNLAMTKTIQRVRNVSNSPTTKLSTLADIMLPHSYTTTSKNDDFLLFDSGPEAQDQRLLIFSTTRNLEFLRGSEHWHADGTFKTAPKLFAQVYTLHGSRLPLTAGKRRTVLPLVYALLPGKTQNIYSKVLSVIKDMLPDAAPETMMNDFEFSFLNAVREVFPGIRQKGCFFHFSQAVFRQIQQHEDVLKSYGDDAAFALNLRHLIALAFVPEEDVVGAFQQLMATSFFQEPVVQGLLGYFEGNWVGRVNLGQRQPPLFAVSMWNCYLSVLNGEARTNNDVEGFHRALQILLGNHPTVWRFIDGIKKKQASTEIRMEHHLAGHEPPPMEPMYRQLNERLVTVVSTYADVRSGKKPLLDYLRGVAHNITYHVS